MIKEDKKYFCTAPWVHMHTWPDGKVFPCCNCNIVKNFGNLNDTSLSDIWNSEEVIQFRKDLLDNIPRPDYCSRCYEMEESGSISLRNDFNNKFYNEFEEQSKNKEVPLKLYHWDFRFSNLCNQSCRTCGYYLSSSWYDDFYSQYGKTPPDMNLKFTQFTKDNMNKQIIEEQIMYVKEINFAGGEPTIMEEHKFILEELLKHGRTDVKIRLTTNLSSLNFKGLNFLEVWPKFELVDVCVSLDEIEDRAEFWRNGTNWGKLIKNIKQVKDLTIKFENVKLNINITTSIFNSHRLTAIIQYLIDEKICDDGIGIYYNPLIEPNYFNAKNMPESYKIMAIKDLESLKLMPYQKISNIDPVINKLKLDADIDAIKKAAKELAQIDKIRGQSLEKIAPELYTIYKDYGYDEYYAEFEKHI